MHPATLELIAAGAVIGLGIAALLICIAIDWQNRSKARARTRRAIDRARRNARVNRYGIPYCISN